MLALAVHPSGKLALTAGADRTLRLWDLTTGRTAFQTRLPQGACDPPHRHRPPSSYTSLTRTMYACRVACGCVLAAAEMVQWSATGALYAVVSDRAVECYRADVRTCHMP